MRIALVGCGAVSRLYHAPALEALARAGELDVCAFVDPDPAAAAAVAERFPRATVLDDAASLAGVPLDLAIVASPPRFHAEHAVALLRAGVAVLCEKPLAPTASDAETIVVAAENAKRVLAVGMIRRFLPATALIGRILGEKMLGAVTRVSCREGGVFRWPAAGPSFFERSNGGVLPDIGVHLLDLLVWWLGVPQSVSYADDEMGGVEANCRLQLTFPGGTEADVRLSRDWPQPNRYVFECERGRLTWNVHEPTRLGLTIHGATHGLDAQIRAMTEGRDGPTMSAPVAGFEAAFEMQLRDVIAAVRDGGTPAVSGRAVLGSLRVIDECYAVRTQLPMPWLGEAEQNEARRLSGTR